MRRKNKRNSFSIVKPTNNNTNPFITHYSDTAGRTYQAINSLSSALRLTDYDLLSPQTDLSTLGAYDNVKIDLLSLHPYLLTFLYKTYGVLAKMVELPVKDAYRNNGFVLDADTLDDDELLQLQQRVYKFIPVIIKGRYWSRLFGGGALICLDGGDLSEPLILDNLQGKKIDFVAVDRWQLNYSKPHVSQRGGLWQLSNYNTHIDTDTDSPNNVTIHDSRIKILYGNPSPFITNNMVQGWGLSVYENIFKDMNTLFKGQNVLFELLDESKIDIIKLAAMDMAISSSAGERALEKTVDLIARSQNYKSKLLLSTNDQYEQKQINFAGLEGLSKEIRIMMAANADIPVNKLYGEGVTGFGSGQDSLENYNAMIENSIRLPDGDIWEWIIKIMCFNLFGDYQEDDISLNWNGLRVLSSIDQQNINDHKIANLLQLYDRKLLTPQELMEALNSEKLFRQDTKALRGELESTPLYNVTADTPEDTSRQYNITDLKDITV